MSASTPPASSLLSVKAPEGTEIIVRDETYQAVKRGLGVLKATLEPGAYEIEYRIGPTAITRPISLRPGRKTNADAPEQFRSRGVVPGRNVRGAYYPEDHKIINVSKEAYSASKPVALGKGGEVFVFVRPLDVAPRLDTGRSLSIETIKGETLAVSTGEDAADARHIDLEEGTSGFRVALQPGLYVLKAHSGRRVIRRLLPVFRGRRTDIWLGYQIADQSSYGISPHKVTMSAALQLGEPAPELDSAYWSHLERLEVATASMAVGRIGLGLDGLKALTEPVGDDPCGHLFSAAQVVALLRRRLVAQSVHASKEMGRQIALFDRLVDADAATIVASMAVAKLTEHDRFDLGQGGGVLLPDALALGRWLSRYGAATATKNLRTDGWTLRHPTLLTVSLNAALEESFHDKGFLKDDTLAADAGRIRWKSTPWLAWNRRLVGRSDPSAIPTEGDLDVARAILLQVLKTWAEADDDSRRKVALGILTESEPDLLSAIGRSLVAQDDRLFNLLNGAQLSTHEALSLVAVRLGYGSAQLIDRLKSLQITGAIVRTEPMIGSSKDMSVPMKQGTVKLEDWLKQYRAIIKLLGDDLEDESDERFWKRNGTWSGLQRRLISRFNER